jgi:hypothetical protein
MPKNLDAFSSNFTFTSFEVEKFKSILEDMQRLFQFKYVCYGIELTPTTDHFHLQGYIELTYPTTIRNLLKLHDFGPLTSFFIARGTRAENQAYCSKSSPLTEVHTNAIAATKPFNLIVHSLFYKKIQCFF